MKDEVKSLVRVNFPDPASGENRLVKLLLEIEDALNDKNSALQINTIVESIGKTDNIAGVI